MCNLQYISLCAVALMLVVTFYCLFLRNKRKINNNNTNTSVTHETLILIEKRKSFNIIQYCKFTALILLAALCLITCSLIFKNLTSEYLIHMYLLFFTMLIAIDIKTHGMMPKGCEQLYYSTKRTLAFACTAFYIKILSTCIKNGYTTSFVISLATNIILVIHIFCQPECANKIEDDDDVDIE